MINKGWEASKRKKRRTDADMVSEGFANVIVKGDRLANAPDVNL